MKTPSQRRHLLLTLAAVVVAAAMSCGRHEEDQVTSSRYALDRSGPLSAPAGTVLPTETNGTTFTSNGNTTLNLTDDLAPKADVATTSDGALAVHVPLWVSPGRAEMQPNLALDYNSRAGLSQMGIVGFGWRLGGLPVITRCPKTAADTGSGSLPVTFTATDQLCVDGEPLVPENSAATIYTDGAAFRLLNDDHRRFIVRNPDSSGPTQIIAYGRDGRITIWGTDSSATDPDGQGSPVGGFWSGSRYSFQTCSGASQCQGPDTVQVNKTIVRYGWLLATSTDRNANRIVYEWITKNSPCTGDVIETDASSVGPKAIFYAQNTTTGLAATKSVRFSYVLPSSGSYLCARPPGQAPMFVSGMRVDPRMRIASISMFGPSADGTATTGLHTYYFDYNDATVTPATYAESHLSDVHECDGTSASPVCKPGLHFSYGETEPLDGEWTDINTNFTNIYPVDQQGSNWPPRIYTPDIDRDGRDDFIFLDANTPTKYDVLSSTGNPSNPVSAWGGQLSPSISTASRLFPTDFFGGGFPDAMLLTEDSIFSDNAIYQWTDGAFSVVGSPNPLNGVTAGEMADLNGDGLPDLIETTGTDLKNAGLAWDYRLNGVGTLTAGGQLPTGPNDHRLVDVDGDGSTEILSIYASPDPTRYTAFHAGSGKSTSAPSTLDVGRPYVWADLNGDGLVDAVELGRSKGDSFLYVWINSGGATSLIASPTTTGMGGFFPPIPVPTSFAVADSTAVRTIDFNNDGKQDLVFRPFNVDGVNLPLTVLWYDGWNFNLTTLPSQVYSNTQSGTNHEPNRAEMFQVMDFNGDGLDDIAMVNNYTSTSPNGTLHIFARLGSGQRNRMLQSVVRSGVTRGNATIAGERFDIEYQPLTSPSAYVDTGQDNRGTYPRVPILGKLWVVSALSRSNETHSEMPDRTEYTYANARKDLRGRGFLGFESVTAKQLVTGVQTQTQYDTQTIDSTRAFYPFIGMPKQITTTSTFVNSNGDTTTRQRTQINTLAVVKPVSGRPIFFSYPSANTDTVVEIDPSLNSTRVYSHSSSLTLDPNGNASVSSATRDGGTDSTSDTIAYVNDGLWPRVSTDVRTETSTTASDSLTRTTKLTYDTKWNLTRVDKFQSAAERNRGETAVSIAIAPNANGLPKTITTTGVGCGTNGTRTVTYVYDATEQAFPSVITDSLGHIKRFGYHPGFGVVGISEDENALPSTFTFDGLGRPRAENWAVGATTSYSYAIPSSETNPTAATDTLLRIRSTRGDGRSELVEVNWRGRPTVRRVWSRPDGKAAFESYVYDPLDRLQTYYRPSFALNGGAPYSLQYDSLGRITQENRSDGSVWSYGYTGLERDTTDVTDGILTSAETFDSQGRTVSIHESFFQRFFLQFTTRYAYGPFNTLYSITDPNGNQNIRTMNRLGKLWTLTDHDAGTRTYAYNAFGQLEQENTTEYSSTSCYDTGGRISTETAGTRITTYHYDTAANGIAKLASIVSPDQITTAYGYDTQGRLSSEQWTVGAENLTIGSSYDTKGRLAQMTYPLTGTGLSALTVNYGYDPTYGSLTSINDASGHPYWTWNDSDASGEFTTETFGNGTGAVAVSHLESTTNPTTLGRIQVAKGTTMLRDISYTVDGRRNVLSRTDNLGGTSELFGYDAIDHLRNWQWMQGTNTLQEVNYFYDALGNLTSRQIAAGNGTNFSFTFDTSQAGPHQPISSTLGSYAYDGNGRQKTAPGRTVTYNESDLPTLISNRTYSEAYQFAYDGESNRVLKQRSNGDVTLTLGRLYERFTPKNGVATHRHTVMGPSGPVAVISMSGGGGTTVSSTSYVLPDYEGSTTQLADLSGSAIPFGYDPYGARIQPTPPEVYTGQPVSGISIGFTGHVHDDETALGLINMQGRMYDPTQARFLSPDPLQHPFESQGLNPYAYARNNPTSRIDPTGFGDQDAQAPVLPPVPAVCNGEPSCDPYQARQWADIPDDDDDAKPKANPVPVPTVRSPETQATTDPFWNTNGNYDGRSAGGFLGGAGRTSKYSGPIGGGHQLWANDCGPYGGCWVGIESGSKVNAAADAVFNHMSEHNHPGDAKAIAGFAVFAVVMPFTVGTAMAYGPALWPAITTTSSTLGRALIRGGMPRFGRLVAHHIIPRLAWRAAGLRMWLAATGIGINSAANGVWLTRGYHAVIHTQLYLDTLWAESLEIDVANQEAAIEFLDSVANRLVSGEFPY